VLISVDTSPFGKLKAERKNLPIFRAKQKLIKKIIALESAIIIGETGSGKTTQIPQVRSFKSSTLVVKIVTFS